MHLFCYRSLLCIKIYNRVAFYGNLITINTSYLLSMTNTYKKE